MFSSTSIYEIFIDSASKGLSYKIYKPLQCKYFNDCGFGFYSPSEHYLLLRIRNNISSKHVPTEGSGILINYRGHLMYRPNDL